MSFLVFCCCSSTIPLLFPCCWSAVDLLSSSCSPPVPLLSPAVYLLFLCCSSPVWLIFSILVSFFVPRFHTQPPAFFHSNLMKSDLLEMLPINAKHWSVLYVYQTHTGCIFQALPAFMSFVFPDKWNLLSPCFNIYAALSLVSIYASGTFKF